MRGPARGVLREEPSASITLARVCEGRGRRGYGHPYSGTKPETVDTCQGVAYGCVRLLLLGVDVGGVDRIRTRGLRRDRPAPIITHRSRPRKIGVGSPASWSSGPDRRRVFLNGLQVLASVAPVRRYRPRPSNPRIGDLPRSPRVAGVPHWGC